MNSDESRTQALNDEWTLLREKLLKVSPRDAPALIRIMRRMSDLLDALGTPEENWAAYALGQSVIQAHPVARERDEARALLATLREAADPVRAMIVDPTDGLLSPPETMAARVLSHGWTFVNAIEPLRRALDITRAPVGDLFARCRAETIRRAERAIFALSLRADCTFENAQAIGWCQATVLSLLEEEPDPAPSHPLAELRIDLTKSPERIAHLIGYRDPRILVLVRPEERERAKAIVKDANVRVFTPNDPILGLRIDHLVRTAGAVGSVEWETRCLNTRLTKNHTVTVIADIDKLEETLCSECSAANPRRAAADALALRVHPGGRPPALHPEPLGTHPALPVPLPVPSPLDPRTGRPPGPGDPALCHAPGDAEQVKEGPFRLHGGGVHPGGHAPDRRPGRRHQPGGLRASSPRVPRGRDARGGAAGDGAQYQSGAPARGFRCAPTRPAFPP